MESCFVCGSVGYIYKGNELLLRLLIARATRDKQETAHNQLKCVRTYKCD